MLQLPEAINEELTPSYSKAEIQALKDEIDEENKVSDIERVLEAANPLEKGLEELDEYKELPFKIGDEVMVDYTDIETGELKSIESKIHDIYMIYDIFTSKPEIIVTVTNDFCHNEQIGDWRKYIKVK